MPAINRLFDPGYLKHLEELRKTVISVMAAVILLTALCFCFIPHIIAFLQRPISMLNVQLNYFTPYEKFLVYMKISFFAGLFLAAPFAMFRAGQFIYPALNKKERPYFYIFAFLIPAMFISGLAFGYLVLVPAAFRFFVNFAAGDNVRPVWGIDQYFGLIMSMICMSGIIFLVPLLLVFLMKAGLVKPQTLEKFRRHIIVLIAVIAGIFAPPDLMSMVLLGIPLYLLFEASIIVGKII